MVKLVEMKESESSGWREIETEEAICVLKKKKGRKASGLECIALE